MADTSVTDEELKAWLEFPPAAKGRPSPEMAPVMAARKSFIKGFGERVGLKQKKAEAFLIAAGAEAAKKSAAAAAGGEGEETKAECPISLCPPSGTRDFYPEEMRMRNWLFGHMRATADMFGFTEYDAPVLESVALYERKAGEEITEQMYNFVDKEDNRVTLRPEMTPTLARMVLAKTQGATGDIKDFRLPLKWFSVPQCWRFETCQRGRKREHYQWNMDIVGVSECTAELELLAAMVFFFERLGIGSDTVQIRVNSRKVLDTVTTSCGVAKEDFAKVCVILDKLDKIGGEGVTAQLAEMEPPVSSDVAANLIKAMSCPTLEELLVLVRSTGSEDVSAIEELQTVFSQAEAYGIRPFLKFDASVVRGLSYYTGIVFEAFDLKFGLRAIAGGGRYDNLLKLYGSPKQIPCCGFGFGDCVIMELLEEMAKERKADILKKRTIDFVVCARTKALYGQAASVAFALRKAGFKVDLLQEIKKTKKAFDHANNLGAQRVAFIAEDEWDKGLVRVKHMTLKDEKGEGLQADVPFGKLAEVRSFFGEPIGGGRGAAAAEPAAEPADEAKMEAAYARMAELATRVAKLEA